MERRLRIIPYSLEAPDAAPLMIRRQTLWADYPAHGHDYDELEIILSGSGRQWLNGQYVPFAAGNLFLLSPEDFHRVEIDEEVRLLSIHFLPDAAEAMGFGRLMQAYTMQLEEARCARYAPWLDELSAPEARSRPYYAQELQAATMQLLVTLLREGTACPLSKPARRLQQAIVYIQTHYTEPGLRVAEVAAHCGLSACYFSSLFYQEVGCRFSDYVGDLRLRRACGLLEGSAGSVTEIAFDAGYASLPHFFRSFRKAMGCTPAEYRAQTNHTAKERKPG